MKIKVLVFIVSLFSLVTSCLSNASELADDKSRALLAEIQADISQTAAKVRGLEIGHDNTDWSIHLFRSNEKLVRIGVVIEPRSQLILSVTAGGVGEDLGLKAGDVVTKAYRNGSGIESNISQLELTHGDGLKLIIDRGRESITLEGLVRSNYTPRWELYSKAESIPDDFSSDSGSDFEHYIQSEKSSRLLKALQSRIDNKLAEIYRLESKHTQQSLSLEVYQKEDIDTKLGILIDKKTSTVVSVVDDSNGESLGFQSGDVITQTEVNGVVRKNGLKNLDMSDGDSLSFTIRRDGEELLLSSKAKSVRIPPWKFSVNSEEIYKDDTCGIVTVFFDTPFTKDIYKAQLTEVDGDLLPPSRRSDSIKLKAGKHRLLIHQKIPSKLKQRAGSGKLIDFLVVPGKRYFLGVKFDRNKRFSKTDKFWQPYVWKVEDYECSLD